LTGNLTTSTDVTRGLLTVAVVGGVLVAAASPDLLAAAMGAALFATALRAKVDVEEVLVDGPAVTAAYEGDGVLSGVPLHRGDGVSVDDGAGGRLSTPPTAPASGAVALVARLG